MQNTTNDKVYDFFDITKSILQKKSIGNAYLIKSNNSYDRKDILDFIKKIVNLYNISTEEKNNLYEQIDYNTFPDLKIITADGKFIKKEQIIKLQEEFKTYSLYNEKRFYIIEFAENLNNSSANSLLKFLEEPQNDVIALLITKNINNVIDTIVSRCQVLNLFSNLNMLNDMDNEIIQKSISNLNLIINYQEKSIAYLTELYSCDTQNIKKILSVMLFLCFDCINYKVKQNFEIFSDKKDIIVFYNSKLSITKLICFVNCLEDAIYNINFNFNTKLILDKLIIEMVGV